MKKQTQTREQVIAELWKWPINAALNNIGKYDELMQQATGRQQSAYKGLLRRWQRQFEALRDARDKAIEQARRAQ